MKINTSTRILAIALLVAAGACNDDATGPSTTVPGSSGLKPNTQVDGLFEPSGAFTASVAPEFPDERDDGEVFDDGNGGPVDRESFDGSEDRRRWTGRGPWSVVDVVSFADPSTAVGRSRLRRTPGRVHMGLVAEGLAPGTATTLWAVVFNNPQACVGECDDPDLFSNPATQADLMYVAGDVTDSRGVARYNGSVRERDTRASIMPLFDLPAWGIIDERTAEVHLIVRTHGPVIGGLRRAQTTTFNGGCTGFGPEFGTPGPNECAEPYFASHYPDEH